MIQKGDVVQITDENPDRAGWVGAFLLVTEAKSWGVQGFVHKVETHQSSSRLYIRLPYEAVELIGQASMVPQDESSEED